MAIKTYALLKTDIVQVLQDTGMAEFLTAEIDVQIPLCLDEISRISPRRTKESHSTTESSRKLTLTTEHKRHLLSVERLEYKVDQWPEQFRNFERWGDVLTMAYDGLPTASETVYLYLTKRHILQSAIGTTDTAGAVKTQAAAGATSLVLKSLGTGTVNEDTKLTIAGDATKYHVTAQVTIASSEATVTITPVLAALAAVDAVVTLALADSTLETPMEAPFVDYVAGKCAISKARNTTSLFSIDMEAWGSRKVELATAAFRGMARTRVTYLEARI